MTQQKYKKKLNKQKIYFAGHRITPQPTAKICDFGAVCAMAGREEFKDLRLHPQAC